ncbi:MAG: AbrB/MazE/SpoVT family DNA-binding domain-containing protein [Clostridia bacterium]|nr:AbrB/MazE/SpoVT family DNA-binding domain-containing protein [Clostridia bacterium]
MASTGVVREIDSLGRITLPKEVRDHLSMPAKTPILIHVEGTRIILEKSSSTCYLCGSAEEVKSLNGKGICSNCIAQIKAEF